MYSRHDGGFLANSKFSQIRRARALHVPQRVFIRRMPHSETVTPVIRCHFAITAAREIACVPDTSEQAELRECPGCFLAEPVTPMSCCCGCEHRARHLLR